MAGRKRDPVSSLTVHIHKDKHYRYAATQVYDVDPKSGVERRRYIHWGTVSDDLVFTPNQTYRLTPRADRIRLVFPPDWDVSKADVLNGMTAEEIADKVNLIDASSVTASSTPASEERCPNLQKSPETEASWTTSSNAEVGADGSEERNAAMDEETNLLESSRVPAAFLRECNRERLYGAVWLLENIAENTGLIEDLTTVFKGNLAPVNEVISLGIFPYIGRRSYSRFFRWQRIYKTMVDYDMTSPYITRLTQSITDDDRMALIKLRVARQPKNALESCDSTTRSAWGKCLADIKWGKNKDNPKLQNTVEVLVHSVTTHEAIYYRSFAGNVNDMSTVRTIISDLTHAGFQDLTMMLDRGYDCQDNLVAFVAADIPFIMCAKAGTKPVLPLLADIQYTDKGVPINMEYDLKRRLYYTQVDVPPYTGRLADDTEVLVSGLKANLFLNIRKRMDELGAIHAQVMSEKAELDEMVKSGKLPENIKAYNALYTYHKVSLVDDGTGPKLHYEENSKLIAKNESKCGFFSSLIYKVKKTAIESLDDYLSRDEHEKSWDIMKNLMEFNTQDASSEDGKAGRLFILFCGLIMTSKLAYFWRSTDLKTKYASTYEILDEMESIRCIEYTDGTTHMQQFTTAQYEIATLCGAKVPEECVPAVLRRKNK